MRKGVICDMTHYTLPGPTPKTPPSPLGRRVQEERLKKGWSRGVLAMVSGLSEATIKAIETGTHEPLLFTITCIAQALEVSLDFLALGERKNHD